MTVRETWNADMVACVTTECGSTCWCCCLPSGILYGFLCTINRDGEKHHAFHLTSSVEQNKETGSDMFMQLRPFNHTWPLFIPLINTTSLGLPFHSLAL